MNRLLARMCAAVLFGAVATIPTPLQGQEQGLRAKLTELFTFGGFDTPLLLLTPANGGDPAQATMVNEGFVPDVSQANAALLGFFNSWMRGTVANAPIGSLTGGATFTFGGGTPAPSAVSPGPIVGEVGRTLGRGRTVVGATASVFRFDEIRGVPLDDIRFNFTHAAACDARQAACSASAASASDVVELRIALDYDLAVTSLFANYGVTDRVDVGVVVPLVHTSLSGTSQAQVIPFSAVGGGRVATLIGGTPENPVLASTQSTEGSATGLGDVAVRGKARLWENGTSQVAVVGDLRLPTGDEDDLLGAGSTSARALGVVSTRMGNFAPYANVGYRYWAGDAGNDAVLGIVGFDQLLSRRVSLAAALVSELQVGRSVYQVPAPVTLPGPSARTVRPAEIPDIRDDALSAALGFKFVAPTGLVAIVNGMVPLGRGGPRPDLGLSAGVQYAF